MDIELVVKHVLKAIVENFMKLKFDFAEKKKNYFLFYMINNIYMRLYKHSLCGSLSFLEKMGLI